MLFSQSTALVLALATGFASQATAYPWFSNSDSKVVARYPYNAPALPAPEVFPPLKRNDKKKGGNKSDNDVIKITQVNVKEVVDGNNVAIVKTVQTILIQNSDDNKKKNKSRKDSYKKKDDKKTTVLIVVQVIVTKIEDNKGNKIEQLLFAQSVITANKGQKQTETIMITDASTLIASVEATGKGGKGGKGSDGTAVGTEGVAAATEVGTAAAASVTGDAGAAESVTLLDAAPTWTSIEADPIASLLAQASDLIS